MTDSEIPADIMETAKAAMSDPSAGAVLTIARLVFEERKRGAKVESDKYQQYVDFSEEIRSMLGMGYGEGYQLSDMLRVVKGRNSQWLEFDRRNALSSFLATECNGEGRSDDLRAEGLLKDQSRRKEVKATCGHVTREGHTALHDHIRCNGCGSIRTDWGESWGVAGGGKWFRSLYEANFYKNHGRLPDEEAA